MTKVIDKKIRRKIRKGRSNVVKGTKEKPRVVLSKSNRYLRVQAVDDTAGHTLLFSSTAYLVEEITNYSRKNKESAKKLGEVFASELKKEGIVKIVPDRNGWLYHGNIQVFYQTMRELGISF